MIWTIARREILEALVTGRAVVLFLIATGLLGTGLYVMYRDFDARRANYDVIRPEASEPIAVTPPNPLSVFARGLDDAMGRSFEVRVTGIDIGGSQASANPLFGLFPTPDWLYLFKVVFALIAFLIGFDLICGDKERGTLKLMVTNGAARGQVALGKWLGGWLAFLVPIGLAVGLWLAVSGPLFGLGLSRGDWGRLAVLLGLAAIYLSVCFTVALAISALFQRSAAALAAALLVWVLFVFVIPDFGVLIARQISPVKPLGLVSSERNRIFGSEMMKAFDEYREGAQGSVFERHWREMHVRGDQLSERVAGELGRLSRTSARLTRISPAGAFASLASRTLGTSVADEARFKRDVRGYKNAILPQVFDQTTGRSEPTYQTFRSEPAALGEVLAAGRGELVALLIVGALAMAALFISLNRYDIR